MKGLPEVDTLTQDMYEDADYVPTPTATATGNNDGNGGTSSSESDEYVVSANNDDEMSRLPPPSNILILSPLDGFHLPVHVNYCLEYRFYMNIFAPNFGKVHAHRIHRSSTR